MPLRDSEKPVDSSYLKHVRLPVHERPGDALTEVLAETAVGLARRGPACEGTRCRQETP
jgi:hypothetical protein